MRRPSLRSVFLLGILVGLVAALVRLLLRDARPAPAPLASPPPPLPSTVAAPPVPVPVEVADAPGRAVKPTRSPVDTAPATPPQPPDAPASAPAPTPAPPAPEASERPSGDDGPAWVAAVEGGCPDGYPIKAKVGSGIYHRPGGLSYERTRPDRCYPDVAAAEADGFRAAKR